MHHKITLLLWFISGSEELGKREAVIAKGMRGTRGKEKREKWEKEKE